MATSMGFAPRLTFDDQSLIASSLSARWLIIQSAKTCDPNESFLIVINARVKGSGGQAGVFVELPKIRTFEIRKEQRELFATLVCGAGCQGNSSGCYIFRDAIFASDQDYYLLPDSVKVVKEAILGGPGVRQYAVSWTDNDRNERITRMVGHPHSEDGNSGDTQGTVEIAFSAIAERQSLVEVKN